MKTELRAENATNDLPFPEIPETLIAQEPLTRRDEARLMVLDRREGNFGHRRFFELDQFFGPNDVLVLNDVKVFPARLIGKKPTGGKVKILLIKKAGEGEKWTALLTPALKPGAEILLEEGFSATVLRKRESGEYEIAFNRSIDGDLPRLGQMPLPPYIHREGREKEPLDRQYYQTVFAGAGPNAELLGPGAPFKAFAETEGPALQAQGVEGSPGGAIAAPTASLHFTEELLEKIRARGVKTVFLRLNVGWGTFRPIRAGDYRRHKMLPEEFVLPEETAEAVNEARGRVWAVGTTVVRALESMADAGGRVQAGEGETDLYIYPGYTFKAVDALVTNFHLPGHTPLLLAAAFAGEDLLRKSYEEAIRERYRFFSYGDAMLIS